MQVENFWGFLKEIQFLSAIEGEPTKAAKAGKRKRARTQNRGLKKKLEGLGFARIKVHYNEEDKPKRECRIDVLREIYKFFMEHQMSYFWLTYLRLMVEVGKAAFAKDMKEQSTMFWTVTNDTTRR